MSALHWALALAECFPPHTHCSFWRNEKGTEKERGGTKKLASLPLNIGTYSSGGFGGVGGRRSTAAAALPSSFFF